MDNASRCVARLAGVLMSCLLGSTIALAAQDPDRIALEAAMQRWMTAVNARDVRSLAATMTEDVRLLDASAPEVAGRDAAIGALRDVANRGRLIATNAEITIARDVAWRVVALTQTHADGVVHARGQSLEIWKRVRGEWKLHRQMAAGIIAPADWLTRPSTGEPVLDQPKD